MTAFWPIDAFRRRLYSRRCLSISGLGDSPRLEKVLRRRLARALSLGGDAVPTACCCIHKISSGYEIVIMLHVHGKQYWETHRGTDKKEVVRKLLASMDTHKGLVPYGTVGYSMPRDGCRECSTRKAHVFTNRFLQKLNPLN